MCVGESDPDGVIWPLLLIVATTSLPSFGGGFVLTTTITTTITITRATTIGRIYESIYLFDLACRNTFYYKMYYAITNILPIKDLPAKHSRYLSVAIIEAEKSDLASYRLGSCIEEQKACILRT
jgi:hypothetical protein